MQHGKAHSVLYVYTNTLASTDALVQADLRPHSHQTISSKDKSAASKLYLYQTCTYNERVVAVVAGSYGAGSRIDCPRQNLAAVHASDRDCLLSLFSSR